VRLLPYDDPGQPDLRSPARYLLWTAGQQWQPLLVGTIYGITWMGAQALVPAAIGRGLDAGVADHDMSAAWEWSGVVLGLAVIQAVFGVLRHRVAVACWLYASFRSMQLLGRHSAEVGVAIRRKLPTGEVVSAATNDALMIGGSFDIFDRLGLAPHLHGGVSGLALDVFGIAVIGLASALYIGASFGAGPRDSLMLAIVRRGPRISVASWAIQIAALAIGYAFGGSAGIGTVLFALGLGPCMEGAYWVLMRLGITHPATQPSTTAANPVIGIT